MSPVPAARRADGVATVSHGAEPAADDAIATDGRRARAERNRDAVVEAILDLIEERDGPPTIEEVAERSGVSVRSVFRHFDDIESLYAAAVEAHLRKVIHLFTFTAPSGAVEARVDAIVAQRAKLYEGIAPVRRVAERKRQQSRAIGNRLREAREASRQQVAECFAPELAAERGADRHDLLDALEAATSWATWEELRREQELSVARASRVVRRTLLALVG